MYKSKSLTPLKNDKCLDCRFCIFDKERCEEGCELPEYSCIDNSHFEYYQGIYDKSKKKMV